MSTLTVLRSAIAVACLSLPLLLAAADSSRKSSVDHWSMSQLQTLGAALHDKVTGPRKNITFALEDFGNSSTAMARREANGPGESHADSDDYFIVQSGKATLLTGGSIVNAKQTDPGEIRGDGLTGGDRRELNPGDIVHIGAGVTHQLLVNGADGFTYFIVKTQRK